VDVFPFDYYTDVNKDMVKLDTYRRLSVYTFYGIHNKNAKLKNIARYLLVLVFRLTHVKTWNQKMNNLLNYFTLESLLSIVLRNTLIPT